MSTSIDLRAQLAVARQALQEVESLPEITHLIDRAEVLRTVARQVGLSRDAQNDWAEYKIDAQRKAGQMLKQMELKPGARPQLVTRSDGNGLLPIALRDLGVTKNQSSSWQRIAALPDDDFEEYKTRTRSAGKEITEAGALARAKHFLRELNKQRDAQQAAEIVELPAVVTHASYADWLPLQDDCDLLLTDPPYSTDVDDIEQFVNDWLPLALNKVLPTGRAYVCIGAYPAELRAYLNVQPPPHLRLQNVLVWTYRNTLGPRPTHQYKLNWQAILYYQGMDANRLNCSEMTEQFAVQDLNAPDGRHGDRWHSWQKPDELAERFIRHSTTPEDLVLDPFACTGTFPLVAARLGRRGVGCEIDADAIEIARNRGCQIA